MITAKHFCKLNYIVVALAHLFTIDGNHIVVHPVAHWRMVIADGTLCNFTFMVRKLQIHATAMDIKFCSQIFGCHCGTFNVPAGKTLAPWACPPHNMLWRCRFPQGKINTFSFFALSFQLTGNHLTGAGFKQIIKYPSAQLSIIMRSSIFFYIKIYGAINFVCITGNNNFLNHVYLLHNMAGSSRFNAWFYTIKLQHRPMKKVGIFLHQFHRFQFFQLCFFAHFILSLPTFLFKMPGISNVAYVAYFVSFMR